ncbi:non-specific serine/threonine protein kinase [Ranunculus cassubicifolius]
MWRFKPFTPKERAGLEGRTIDVGNIKVHVHNVIAEGGFSCVYLARDAVHASKQYALKHIICSDEESLELVMKEISVMKKLTGHPNIVALQAYTILDMGRTKEALIVMDFCEKSLVNVLEGRGSGYFDENKILLIFRDVCNAVFAMHCLSPPIAHRDLKAENLLLGPDGMWKLCDFGSTSTNHKRFERPEEMGIEEDNIRKYTTPAYRAPEMWDLFRKEVINEKVDIWALGCLLYRICYFKSAFDGESKLQILNGNYRIPDLPKYNSSITDLIKDMLHGSPDSRPDITQVWFRVNDLLPGESQKTLPDTAGGVHLPSSNIPDGGIQNTANKSSPMPRRSPPPPPSSKEPAGIGAFWSTQHATESHVAVDKDAPVYDEPKSRSPEKRSEPEKVQPRVEQDRARPVSSSNVKKFDGGPSGDFQLNFFPEDRNPSVVKSKVPQSENTATFQNDAFNSFVADFDTSKFDTVSSKDSSKEQALEAEVNRLKEQLRQSNLEKDEITSKYEKLSAICRSQRQEIQDLKQSLVRTPSPNTDSSKVQSTPSIVQREKIEGSVLELQQGMLKTNTPTPESKNWQAFSEESKSTPKSVRTTNGRQNKNASPTTATVIPDNWGFGADSFTAAPASSNMGRTRGQGNNLQNIAADSKTIENKRVSQPAGWAGF